MKKLPFIFTVVFLLLVSPVLAQDHTGINNFIESFDLKEFGVRFVINSIAIFILVRLIYFLRHRNKDFLFTFTLFNSVNFLICFLLSAAELEVGFAFGLFAIFSIMRYRTVKVAVKEMGYLFLCIAMGLINSLATTQDHYIVLLCSNAFILLIALLLDRTTTSYEKSKQIIYEKIDLIKPELRGEMMADLQNRTGLPVHAVDILAIDLMQDIAIIKVKYMEMHTKNGDEKVSGKVLGTYKAPQLVRLYSNYEQNR
ncbi:MAG: DUF4956 domain-containing protein [Chitinophagales bacterium]|nr:DUF4956 domain-containing protein [Chitinophagales bacterium]